jgi:hypothetical protein
MGSTVCVRCGATLIPHSYCNICHDVLCFICSSCSITTDERIHSYCLNTSIVHGNADMKQGLQEILVESNSPQIAVNSNNYVNTYYNLQNQLNDELKYNLIRLSTSFLFNIFESIKLINRYWTRIFSIGNTNASIT